MDILKEHQEIYHYTTEAGLQGILTSKNIRASHFRGLNDATELNYARGVITKNISDCLSEVCKKSRLALDIKESSEHLSQSLYNSFGEDIYITSFCGYHYKYFEEDFIRCNGLLSQWRGYGKDGGYALVFNPQRLSQELEKYNKEKRFDTYIFDEAIYTNDDPNIEKNITELNCFIKRYITTCNPHGSDGLTPFRNLVTRYKHHAFQEENEVRIAIVRSLPTPSTSKYEDSQTKKLPIIKNINGSSYIELPFDLDAIEKIIIAPQHNQEDKGRWLKKWLQHKELNIPIELSKIPYIN